MVVVEKDREKDSGTDSPGLKDTTQRDDDNDANIDSDPDLRDVEEDDIFDEDYVKGTTKLPPGFIRDTEGRIIVSVLRQLYIWRLNTSIKPSKIFYIQKKVIFF